MSGQVGAVAPQRRIPDQVLTQVMSEHEARLNALAAQQIQIAIMIEYLSQKLEEAVPLFVMDDDEFTEFRDRRFNEMKAEAMSMQEARQKAETAAKAIRNGQTPVDINLDEDAWDVTSD